MKLISFEPKDYLLLAAWVPDDEFNLLWGGPLYDWPVTEGQIAAHQSRPEVSSFLLVNEKRKIGFIEINQISDVECRLCRVLVSGDAGRGRGYGKELIRLAVKHAQENFNARTISLAVFEHNVSALRCYESSGFQTISRETDRVFFNGKNWPLLQMELVL